MTRLKYIKLALASSDWSFARVNLVIATQVVLHVSVILATVPCSKPFLSAFDSGTLHMPQEVELEAGTSGISRATVATYSSCDSSVVAATPGVIGHRMRVDHWNVVLRPDFSRTTTDCR